MHSPLLKESLWVSHPPPTYMLKFSGLADLSSCFEKETSKAHVQESFPEVAAAREASQPRSDQHLTGRKLYTAYIRRTEAP